MCPERPKMLPHRECLTTLAGFFAASVLFVTMAVPGSLAAQEAEPAFTPTLFVVGSTTNNEFRTVDGPVGDSSLYAEMELPFTFSGPRWSGGFSFNPAWRKQRSLEGIDDFDSSVNGWLRGDLSPRTRLALRVGVARSAQLTGLDRADLVTSRADRVRSRASAALTHRLNTVGDTVDFGLDFDRVDYLDGEFVSERSYAAQAGYGRAINPRLSFYVGGGVGRFEYETGQAIHTLSPRVGFNYRLAPRTDLSVRGGVSFVRGGNDPETADDRRTVTAEASLGHSGQSWSTSFTTAREVASGVAFGEPTLRTRLIGSVDWGDPRWRLGLSAGIARNESVLEEGGTLLLLSPDGLITAEARSVDTVSLCLDSGFRMTEWMSIVGSGRLIDQRPESGADSLRLDVYRVSLGIAVHPYAGPIKSRRGADVLRRYGRAGSIGSC